MLALREAGPASLLDQDQGYEQFSLTAPDPLRGLLHLRAVAAVLLLRRMDQYGFLSILVTRMDTRLDTHWIAPPARVLKLRLGGRLVHTWVDLGGRAGPLRAAAR